MKFGSETGSLVNHVLTRSAQPAPEVGMAATVCSWSDRDGATVVHVEGDFVLVRRDESRGVPGHCNAFTESQKWEHAPNPRGAAYWFRRNAEGRWEEHTLNHATGRLNKVKGGGHGLILGRRETFRDPHQ